MEWGLGKERKSPLGLDTGNVLANDSEQAAVELTFSVCVCVCVCVCVWVWVCVR